jgi:hypothetical protein
MRLRPVKGFVISDLCLPVQRGASATLSYPIQGPADRHPRPEFLAPSTLKSAGPGHPAGIPIHCSRRSERRNFLSPWDAGSADRETGASFVK